MTRRAALLATLLLGACTAGGAQPGEPAPNTLIIGIDASGSFRDARLYDDAVQFAAIYIVSHLQGLDSLRKPSALFVGSIGGERPGEPKPFHPINDFVGRDAGQIAADLRTWFPPNDAYTDFNAFFQRVAELVKERGLVLAPLSVVVLSDGVPDVPPGTRLVANESPYARIDLGSLEFLSRSVTVRLLYANPTVGEDWKRLVRRQRVRLWTQEQQVMAGWHLQYQAGQPLAEQHDLWKWMRDNVDFRVRQANLF